MQPSDHHPQQADESNHKERVVDPDEPVRIRVHANACSPERVFGCKASPRHNDITASGFVVRALAVSLCLVSALSAACVPDPHRAQTVELLQQLGSSHALLVQSPPNLSDGCRPIGDVETRLYGEPGLFDVQPAWTDLRDAANALQSACGQAAMLNAPSTGSRAVEDAQARWRQGVERETGIACDDLRAAAAALSSSSPC